MKVWIALARVLRFKPLLMPFPITAQCIVPCLYSEFAHNSMARFLEPTVYLFSATQYYKCWNESIHFLGCSFEMYFEFDIYVV